MTKVFACETVCGMFPAGNNDGMPVECRGMTFGAEITLGLIQRVDFKAIRGIKGVMLIAACC